MYYSIVQTDIECSEQTIQLHITHTLFAIKTIERGFYSIYGHYFSSNDHHSFGGRRRNWLKMMKCICAYAHKHTIIMYIVLCWKLAFCCRHACITGKDANASNVCYGDSSCKTHIVSYLIMITAFLSLSE